MTDIAHKGYSLEDDLAPIMKGKVVLPNFKELPLEAAIASIAAAGGSVGMPDVMNAKLPNDNSNWGHWARYFLHRTQGGTLTGEGYVIWDDSGKGHAGEFAICVHEKVDGAGANHRRGWHPGRCAKCGLDMTVDSSD